MGKKVVFLSLLSLAVILGIGSSFFLGNEPTNVGLAKVYKSLDNIYNETNLVVKAKVLGDYTEEHINNGEVVRKDQVYNIIIEKVYKDNKELKFKKGNSIKYYITVGIKPKSSESFYPIVDFEKLEDGTYILFLNTFYDENRKEPIFLNSSPNHIYKADNKSNFKNVANKAFLSEINEVELEEKIIGK